jgi:hypothetical protein
VTVATSRGAADPPYSEHLSGENIDRDIDLLRRMDSYVSDSVLKKIRE